MARPESLLLLLLALAPAALAILASGSGFNREQTLCQNKFCGCDPDMHTMRCSCPNKGDSLTLRNSTIPVTLRHLIVTHCSHLVVAGDALSSMAYLATVEISQVDSLKLEERAFFYEPHKLVFGQVEGRWVHEIYPDHPQDVRVLLTNVSDVSFPSFSFGGHLEEVSMEDVRVARFDNYAMANTYSVIKTVRFDRCSIDYFAFKSIQKVLIEDLIMTNNRIRKIESSSFKEVLVRNSFQMTGNTIEILASSALTLIGPERVEIRANKLSQVHGDAFHLYTRGSVHIADNTFFSIRAGALKGLRPYQPQYYPTMKPSHHDPVGDYPQLIPEPWEEQARPHELHITNNTLMEYEAGALSLDKGYRVVFQRVQLNLECDCGGIALMAAELIGIHTGINGFTVLSAQNTSALHKSLWCKQSRPAQLISLVSYEDKNCQASVLSSGWSIAIIVASSVLFIILLVGLALIFWCSYRRNKHLLVVPEKKTYQQTEFNVVYEPVTELPPQRIPRPKVVEIPPELQPLREEPQEPEVPPRPRGTTYATVMRVGDSKETVYENFGPEHVIYEEVNPVPATRKVTFANRSENTGSREFLESEII